jgi:hypothetical protein
VSRITSPIYVIFNGDVPFSKVVGLRKILQAVPYRNIRYFEFSDRGSYMMEVTMGHAFSKDMDPTPDTLLDVSIRPPGN